MNYLLYLEMFSKKKNKRNHDVWFLVYNRPNSAKHTYVDICVLTLKICIALYEALSAASPINSSCHNSVWYHNNCSKVSCDPEDYLWVQGQSN